MRSTFKQFLGESVQTSKHDVATFDATNLDMDALMEAYKNSGYKFSKDEWNQFHSCVYGGFQKKDKSHRYFVLWEDRENEDEDGNYTYAINDYYVELGEDGKLVAETGGNPTEEGMTEEIGKRKLAALRVVPKKYNR